MTGRARQSETAPAGTGAVADTEERTGGKVDTAILANREHPVKRLYRCNSCLGIVDPARMRKGRGRDVGEHPEMRFFAECSHNADWYGASIVLAPYQFPLTGVA